MSQCVAVLWADVFTQVNINLVFQLVACNKTIHTQTDTWKIKHVNILKTWESRVKCILGMARVPTYISIYIYEGEELLSFAEAAVAGRGFPCWLVVLLESSERPWLWLVPYLFSHWLLPSPSPSPSPATSFGSSCLFLTLVHPHPHKRELYSCFML